MIAEIRTMLGKAFESGDQEGALHSAQDTNGGSNHPISDQEGDADDR
jgi:hypothetical protein